MKRAGDSVGTVSKLIELIAPDARAPNSLWISYIPVRGLAPRVERTYELNPKRAS